eukprot:gene2630-54267_t
MVANDFSVTAITGADFDYSDGMDGIVLAAAEEDGE